MYKCKVCDRFNTIEWETDTPDPVEFQVMYDILSNIQIVDRNAKPEPFEPATEKQLWTLTHYGVKFNKDTISKQDAMKLIKQLKEEKNPV